MKTHRKTLFPHDGFRPSIDAGNIGTCTYAFVKDLIAKFATFGYSPIEICQIVCSATYDATNDYLKEPADCIDPFKLLKDEE